MLWSCEQKGWARDEHGDEDEAKQGGEQEEKQGGEQGDEQRDNQRGEQMDKQGNEHGSAQGGRARGRAGGRARGVQVCEQDSTNKLALEQRRMRKVVENWCGSKKVVQDLGPKGSCEGQKGRWYQEGS